MKRRSRLISSISALVLAIVLMGFGVYAATSVTSKIGSSVSFISKDVKCTFKVDVDGGKYVDGGAGADENAKRHKIQSVNNESVNTAHTLDEFAMGNYTFDPLTEAGKKITYKVTIINDGNNKIAINYIETKMFEEITNIMSVNKINMKSTDIINVGGKYEGSIELTLLDASADIQVKSLDVSYEVSKTDAEPSTPADQFSYTSLGAGTAELTGYIGTDADIIIPKKDTNGNKITSIGSQAFQGSRITSIVIPEGITGNGYMTFYNASNLISASLPKDFGLETRTFYGCTSLVTITLPANLTSIGASAFEGCSSLTSVVIPNGVSSIGDSAFYKCSSLNTVTLSDNLISIADGAFAACNSLTSITIPNKVTTINKNAFRASNKLSSVELSESLQTIGQSAFENCDIKDLLIPSSVSSIGQSAFYYNTNLSSVYIERETPFTSIGNGAFSGYNQKCTICFYNNDIMNQFYANSGYDSNNTITKLITSASLFEFSEPADGGVKITAYRGNETDIVIPTSNGNGKRIIGIEGYVFNWNDRIESVILPNSIKTIGVSAFESCSKLSSIKLPNGLTKLEDNVLTNCRNLSYIEIPKSVTSIGTSAFAGANFNSITIPENVTSIGSVAFALCENLWEVCFERTIPFEFIGSECFNSLSSDSKLKFKNETVMNQFFEFSHYDGSLTTKELY